MSLSLPVDTYSPDQLSELVLELQDLSSAARDANARRKDDTTSIEAPTLSVDLSQLLQQNNISPDDPSALETFTKEVVTTLEKAPTVHILLAAMPARAMRRQIVTWFRTEINAQSLVTFAARSDLGGGAVVQVGSHLYDLSFRRLIIDHKARITEIAGV